MARRKKTTEEVPLSDFKARCSEYVDRAAEGREIVITRRGERVARLVSEGRHLRSPRGSWKGLVTIEGDIVHTDWSDEFEASRD